MALDLDRILFVPAAAPPHKWDQSITPAPTRLALLRTAVAGNSRFEVSDLELRRAGPSFTVDTLRELHARHREAELFFLLGMDQFLEFDTWRESMEVARLAKLVVLSRDGATVQSKPAIPHLLLEVTRIDISATALRARVAAGEPIRYLVPDGVAASIEREGLYR